MDQPQNKGSTRVEMDQVVNLRRIAARDLDACLWYILILPAWICSSQLYAVSASKSVPRAYLGQRDSDLDLDLKSVPCTVAPINTESLAFGILAS
jgi:hypothetical protein